MRSRRDELLSGIKAELPILLGVIPFGMIYGVLALEAGMPPLAAQAMSAIIFAGSAQFISTQLFAAAAPALVIFATACVVNLRHFLYSASVAPYLRPLKPHWKWLLAYLLTDEAYAVTIIHYQQTGDPPSSNAEDNRHWFLLGSGLALWGVWQLSTAVGIFLGAKVPESWSLDFTIALTFIALVVPALKDRASWAAAVAAGLAAVLAFAMPLRLGLILASLVGILAGLWVEGRS